ncbi:MAG: J domain-containing protein [Bacteroidales bacterium]|nr:J domain-containing protein [Bacteroidales bacterium]
MIPNLYSILHIDRYSSKGDIKKAYRKLALKWHPDKNQSCKAHDSFIEINEAYLILSDEEARAKYNAEYDFFFARTTQIDKEPVFEESTSFSRSNSSKQKSSYRDPDLNNWTFSAKKQAEKYASMSFSDFAKLIGEVIVETGKQGGNAVIYAFSGIIGTSAIFSLFFGINYGDIQQITISIFFLGISIIGLILTSKKYKL